MDPLTQGPRVRRPRRASALMLPIVLIVAVGGCSHRRASMRPVYLSPAPSAGCTNCGSSRVAPAATETLPSSSVEPTIIEPAAEAPAAPLSITPPSGSLKSTPSLDSPPPVTPPVGPGEEPALEPAPSESSKVTPSRSGGSGVKPSGAKGTNSPSASHSGYAPSRRSAPVSGRARQASLRDSVRPFVNDPDDLFAPPKADRPWKYIVLHHSASPSGSYASIDREHRKRLGWDGCGYHFVIGNGTDSPDGQIEVAQRWASQKHGVHCRDGKTSDVNEYGIGICLVGDIDDNPPTARQIESAKALVAYLSDRYAIPADRAETHEHVAASPTTCPGRMFPTASILSAEGSTLRVR